MRVASHGGFTLKLTLKLSELTLVVSGHAGAAEKEPFDIRWRRKRVNSAAIEARRLE